MSRPQCFARFGSELYAKEELRAELASAMLCGQIGLSMGQSHIDSHTAYVSSWMDALRRDKREIFKAAADAQRICDYLGHWMPEPTLVGLRAVERLVFMGVPTCSGWALSDSSSISSPMYRATS